MARDPEELGIEDLGRDDLFIAAAPVLLAEVREQPVVERGALRQEERGRRRERMEREEFELAAELPVVARTGLLEAL